MPRIANNIKDEIQNETRQKLLEAAASEFANYGFTGANINRISIAAGFAKGTIYNYFPSKRDLMLALIDEIGARHAAFIIDKVEAEADAALRLKRFFIAGFDFVEEHPEESQVAISAVFGFDAEFKARIYQAYQNLFDLIIHQIVAYGTERGDFCPPEPDSAAALLMSIYLGGSSLYGPDGRIWLDPDSVVDFVLDGIRSRAV